MKKRIKIYDLCFLGDKSSSKYHDTSKVEWVRGLGEVDSNVVFYTDICLNLIDLAKDGDYKIAMLIEPAAINSSSYNFILQNYSKFDLVLTHHEDLIKMIPNAEWYPSIMSWVAKEDWGRHNKTKNVSIIASDKNYTDGHKLRHEIISRFYNKIDIFGKGYNPVEHKIQGLKDYRFQIVCENCKVNNYFTEKYMDCLYTYTVPIYYGSDKTSVLFDDNGIIRFNSIEDLSDLIEKINKDGISIYNSMLPYIEKNYKKAIEIGPTAEDWIYEEILKKRKII